MWPTCVGRSALRLQKTTTGGKTGTCAVLSSPASCPVNTMGTRNLTQHWLQLSFWGETTQYITADIRRVSSIGPHWESATTFWHVQPIHAHPLYQIRCLAYKDMAPPDHRAQTRTPTPTSGSQHIPGGVWQNHDHATRTRPLNNRIHVRMSQTKGAQRGLGQWLWKRGYHT